VSTPILLLSQRGGSTSIACELRLDGVLRGSAKDDPAGNPLEQQYRWFFTVR
jgi:hypothetical protein